MSVPFRDGTVEVIELGDGPVVGYLHGMLGNPEVHPFLKELAETGHRVVAPSLPGFMPSPHRDDLRFLHDWVAALSEVVDESGLAGAPMVAASVGAMLALELAAVRPEAFERLVLLSPLGLWDDDHTVADLFAVPTGKQPAMLLADPSRAASFFEDDLRAPADETLQHGIDRYHTRRSAASLVWPLPDRGLADRAHRVQVATGLVWGEADRLNPPANAVLYERALPGHTSTGVIAGAGHCVEWDAPVDTAVAVARSLH